MAVVPTLQSLAAKPAAEQVGKWGGAHTMMDLQAELFVCYMTGQALVDYIQAKGGLWALKDLFTQRGFQKLLIAVLRECDNKAVKKVMKKMQIEFTTNMIASKTIMMDAVWQLRMFRWYQHHNYDKKLEYFAEEISMCLPDIVYPLMTFDYYTLLHIPKTQKIYQHRDLTQFEEWASRMTNFPFCTDWHTTVFTFLRAMSESSKKFRWHKVLAFGFYLLAQMSLFDAETRWYKLDIFGKTAVAMANLQVNYNLTALLMQQMLQFRRFPSCKFHTMLCYQKVYAAYGKYKLEKIFFEKIYNSVPRKSVIWAETCKTHFVARIKHVENILAIFLMKKKYYKNTVLHEERYAVRDINRAMKKLDALERLCYQMLSVSTFPNFILDVENQLLPIVKAYIVAADNSLMLWEARHKHLKRINLRLVGQSSAVKSFLNFFTNNHPNIANYLENVRVALEHKHRTTQTKHSVIAGDFYFTQYIFLATFRVQSALSAVFLNSAISEMSKATNNRHYRLALIRASAEVLRGAANFDSKRDFVVDESLLACSTAPIKISDPFSVEKVLVADRDTAILLEFGIEACQKFASITI